MMSIPLGESTIGSTRSPVNSDALPLRIRGSHNGAGIGQCRCVRP